MIEFLAKNVMKCQPGCPELGCGDVLDWINYLYVGETRDLAVRELIDVVGEPKSQEFWGLTISRWNDRQSTTRDEIARTLNTVQGRVERNLKTEE